MTTTINIARDYTTTPGARYPSDGPHSGEDFRDTVLIPIFERSNKDIVVVELDGVEGYPASFLEEAFGGFARHYGKGIAQTKLKFVSADISLIQEIDTYISEAI